MRAEFWWGNLKEEDQLEEPNCVVGDIKIKLKDLGCGSGLD